jgi:uncharacterized protein
MKTKAFALTRRQLVQAGMSAFALGALPCFASHRRTATLTATWQIDTRYQVGQLQERDGQLAVHRAIDLPTRAHGLARLSEGSVLVAARRPGDWLLSWHPASGKTQWHWSEENRRFTGHVLATPEAIYSVETDTDTGAGLIGVRDPATLIKRAEWPTHGSDPHALVLVGEALIVANGGVPTWPETGRARRRDEPVSSSLVSLDRRSGAHRGTWRLSDTEISMRHLAQGVDERGIVLGIALQAQHEDAAQRAAAPVLALWRGDALTLAQAEPAAQGYGGDIAFAQGHFVIGCPRGNCVIQHTTQGHITKKITLTEACAVSADDAGRLWLGGANGTPDLSLATPIKLDNHWL